MEFVERQTRPRRVRISVWPALAVLTLVLAGLGQVASQSALPSVPAASDVVQFLSKTVDWYRQSQREQQIVSEPADLTFADDNHRMAGQIVRLAFDFARQEVQLLEKQPKPQLRGQASNLSAFQGLVQAAARADREAQQTEAELQSLERKRETAAGRKRQDLDSQIAEIKSEIGLTQARSDALHNMLAFVSGTTSSGTGPAGLRGQVEELARSVPAYLSEPQEKTSNEQPLSESSSAKTVVATKQTSSGIWGLATDLFQLSRKAHALKQEIAGANALAQSANQLRAPLVAKLKQMIHSGDQLAIQADTSDPAALAQEKEQLDELTTQFKEVSAVVIPLGKQAILLDLYKRNLANWQDSVQSEYFADLRNLLVRLVFLAVLVGAVVGIGELWRRTIFRYVQDVRRRYQLLLLRRIVLWVGIAVVLIFTFATELGAVVTFAGLITAGIAVALQNVIVAIVGYFFLIGKYGIRVGDRVEVAGVTGSVVDIGMVRFHLMELGQGGTDSQPTGRVVAFSNSIVFQATAGLFKQIPGTSFVWHEIKLTFAAESDHQVVRERVDQAVDTAFADYRDNLERQRRQMERSLASISAAELKPKAHLHFAPSGIEVLIRYPVVLQKAAEVDERLMSALFAAVDQEPKLRLIGSEIPAVKVEA